ncbi:MAG: NAD-dependent epimerase/dehydratase family protein, partial [Acidobacteria bacterium]|nr:NAD-dependent epimerase/dehydratase family protein [Acidobacteriota bacterium]
FAIVHAAFLFSLWLVVWKQIEREGYELGASIETLRRLYVLGFFPLSFLFPVVFSLCGFYTRSRVHAPGYKWRTLVSGTTLASLVYLLGHFLLNRAESLPRAAVLAFLVFGNAGVLGGRWLKHWLFEQELGRVSNMPAGAGDDRPVLVVGGAGYIGSILCRKLLAAGRKVRVLDCLIYGDAAICELLGRPRFELQVGDCRNIQSVVAAVKGVDAIVHLAAIVGDPACEQDRQSALEINFAATRMLIEVAKGHGVERFLFASSCSVYGATGEIVDERSQVAPISLYAETKAESERVLLEARSHRFHPVILRFATVFGPSPRPRFDLLVNLLAAKAYRERKISIYNAEQWRPFIHVEDVAEGILCALRAPLEVVSGEIFNLGDNRMNCTLRDVAEKIREFFPAAEIEWVENTDHRNYRVSFDKIRRRLGFECSWTIEAGIEQMKRLFDGQEALDHCSPIYHNQRYLKQLGTIHEEELDARVMAAFAEALLREERATVNN